MSPSPSSQPRASMALATVTGVLSAMAPAWRASRLDPVVAIRYV